MLGSQSKLLLIDVTPLTLGIETLHGRMTPLIQRNTAIPKKASEIFTTAADNQTSVEIQVYQGERPMASDNKKIGSFHLDGIPSAMRGTPKIEVTFDIDANGILHVTAKDQGTGKENKIRIEGSSGLNKDEIERMTRDAESHAEDDKRKKELADARNEADRAVWEIEKTFKDAGDKISESDKAPILAAAEKVKTAAKGEDPAAVKQAVNELMQASQAMAQHLYSQQGAGPGTGPAPGAAPNAGEQKGGGDDVIDADYEVKK